MVERGRRNDVAAGPPHHRNDVVAASSRTTLIKVGEVTRVEATPPLMSKSTENRFTAAATQSPLRATLRVTEMTALASSAARSGVGAGGGAEGIMEWGAGCGMGAQGLLLIGPQRNDPRDGEDIQGEISASRAERAHGWCPGGVE